jgi:hypothetical protein
LKKKGKDGQRLVNEKFMEVRKMLLAFAVHDTEKDRIKALLTLAICGCHSWALSDKKTLTWEKIDWKNLAGVRYAISRRVLHAVIYLKYDCICGFCD